jgi:hypothetical protein
MESPTKDQDAGEWVTQDKRKNKKQKSAQPPPAVDDQKSNSIYFS